MNIYKTPVMVIIRNILDETYRLEEGNIEVWYDRAIKCWCAGVFNSIGSQIGDFEYEPTKESAFDAIVGYRKDIRVI